MIGILIWILHFENYSHIFTIYKLFAFGEE